MRVTFRRTVHSLAPLLARFKYVKLVLVAPKGLELPEYIAEDLAKYPDCQVRGHRVSTFKFRGVSTLFFFIFRSPRGRSTR